jgi:thioredoxin-like negative regulator of GroEL
MRNLQRTGALYSSVRPKPTPAPPRPFDLSGWLNHNITFVLVVVIALVRLGFWLARQSPEASTSKDVVLALASSGNAFPFTDQGTTQRNALAARVSADPNDVVARIRLAHAIIDRGWNYPEAERLLNEARRLKPDHPPLIAEIADGFARVGRTGTARSVLTRFFGERPTLDAELLAARLASPEQARRLLDNLRARHPKSPKVLLAYAECAPADSPHEILETLAIIIGLDPDCIEAHETRARTYDSLKDSEPARAAWRVAVGLQRAKAHQSPHHPGPFAKLAQMLSDAELDEAPGEGDRDIFDAELYLRDVELLDPHWGIDEMEIGRFQAGAEFLYDQKWSEAVRAFNDSLEETGGWHQHARFGLALALWRLGRAKDAKRLMEICLENRADWPRAKLALATVSTEA